MAYKVLNDQAVGEVKEFGDALMEYLKNISLPKKVSVANEDIRCNDGSEVFHWEIQRMHSWLRNNILDFCKFIRQIHTKSSTHFCQWVNIQTSHKKKIGNVTPPYATKFTQKYRLLGRRKSGD